LIFFHIHGIRAEIIRLGNAPWARFQNLAESKTLALRLDLVALIQGRMVIPQVNISKPIMRLAVSKRGPGTCWPLRFF
jgi:uncharacterized protein involved in outer membrane biogenesis